MADQIVNREHEQFALDGVTPPNPLLLVPVELRKPLGFFWMAHKTILPSITPVAALLATWTRAGLEHGDTMRILRSLTRPAAVAEFKFPSDLVRELGRMVADAMSIKRTRETIERIKREGREAALRREDRSFVADFQSLISGVNRGQESV